MTRYSLEVLGSNVERIQRRLDERARKLAEVRVVLFERMAGTRE